MHAQRIRQARTAHQTALRTDSRWLQLLSFWLYCWAEDCEKPEQIWAATQITPFPKTIEELLAHLTERCSP